MGAEALWVVHRATDGRVLNGMTQADAAGALNRGGIAERWKRSVASDWIALVTKDFPKQEALPRRRRKRNNY